MNKFATRALAAVLAGTAVIAMGIGGTAATAAAPASGARAAATVSSALDPSSVAVERISGADRYAVAVAISKLAFPTKAGTVFIATGQNYPDALSASPAAVRMDGPLLLTNPGALPDVVRHEIVRLSPPKIVVIGGSAAVSGAVLTTLKTLAPTVVRLGGVDRYEVSRTIAKFGRGSSDIPTAYVANGTSFPDALSAGSASGAVGAPIILVPGANSTIGSSTLGVFSDLGTDLVKIAGGTDTVSARMATSVTSAGYGVARLSGTDRFQTAVAINADAYKASSTVYFATGYNFPDALAGSVLAARQKAPLFLVPTSCVPETVLSEIASLGATRVVLLGGIAALDRSVEELKSCIPAPTVPPTTTVVPAPAPAPGPVVVPAPVPVPATETGAIGGWGLPTWRDEFTFKDAATGQPAIDPSKWNVRGRSDLGLLPDAAVPTVGQVSVDESGIAHLKADWLTTPVIRPSGQAGPRELWHKTGYMDQRSLGSGDMAYSQRWGRWEIRAKVPTGPDTFGALAAFWLRNSNSGEIDIMEAWGYNDVAARGGQRIDTATTTIHTKTSGSGNQKYYWTHDDFGAPTPVWDDFHVYAFELTPTFAAMYVDNARVAYATPLTHPNLWNTSYFGSPLHVRMNLHVGPSAKYWGIPDPNHKDWTKPLDFQVDYLRIWKFTP